jgi:hypothetical protein
MIDQRGFSGIGAADNSDADRTLREFLIGYDDVVVVELFTLLDRLRHQHA